MYIVITGTLIDTSRVIITHSRISNFDHLTLLETSRRLVKLQAPENVDGGLIRPMSSPNLG